MQILKGTPKKKKKTGKNYSASSLHFLLIQNFSCNSILGLQTHVSFVYINQSFPLGSRGNGPQESQGSSWLVELGLTSLSCLVVISINGRLLCVANLVTWALEKDWWIDWRKASKIVHKKTVHIYKISIKVASISIKGLATQTRSLAAKRLRLFNTSTENANLLFSTIRSME